MSAFQFLFHQGILITVRVVIKQHVVQVFLAGDHLPETLGLGVVWYDSISIVQCKYDYPFNLMSAHLKVSQNYDLLSMTRFVNILKQLRNSVSEQSCLLWVTLLHGFLGT